MPVDEISANIGLPFGLGQVGGKWSPNDAERTAAWEMYVELITRVTVAELGPDEGLLREALTSYHSLFATTREILKTGGPALARPTAYEHVSFGHISILILNKALRPLLAKWHPILEDHENQRPTEISRLQWEQNWEHNTELRGAIDEVRTTLTSYAGLLAEVCDARGMLNVTADAEIGSTD